MAPATKPMKNPLVLDPSRTTSIRNAFQADMQKRLNRLKSAIWKLIVGEDCFGVRKRTPFKFTSNDSTISCFPADTLVDGALVTKAFRRWYSGPMVEVKTAKGRKFSCTPNHPVLTNRGWVGAGSLNNADYLICNALAERSRWRFTPSLFNLFPPAFNPYVNNRPSSISEVFGSFDTIRVFERVAADPDFHGDGSDGKVDVASANRVLRFGVLSPLTQKHIHTILPPSDWPCLSFRPFCHGLLTNERNSLCKPSDCNTGFSQSAVNAGNVDLVCGGYGYGAFARFIPAYNYLCVRFERLIDLIRYATSCFVRSYDGFTSGSHFAFASYQFTHPIVAFAYRTSNLRGGQAGFVQFNSTCFGFGVNPRPSRLSDFDTCLLEYVPHPNYAKFLLPANFVYRHSTFVELDNVVSFATRGFSGHVYNLETRDGYYSIAGGVYVGNCAFGHRERNPPVFNVWTDEQRAKALAARRRKRLAKAKGRARFLHQKPELTFKGQRVNVVATKEEMQRIREVLGRNISRRDLGHLVGALPGARVAVEVYQYRGGTKKVFSIIQHPLYYAERDLFKDRIENKVFQANKKGRGVGISSFIQQVDHASKHGFERIDTHAAGHYGADENGYYTWPRFGYDAKVLDITASKAKQAGLDVSRVQDFMKTKEGREWWKKNGVGADMSFDLTRGSTSRKVLAAYVRERRKRNQATTNREAYPAGVAPTANGAAAGFDTGGREDIGRDLGQDWQAGLSPLGQRLQAALITNVWSEAARLAAAAARRRNYKQAGTISGKVIYKLNHRAIHIDKDTGHWKEWDTRNSSVLGQGAYHELGTHLSSRKESYRRSVEELKASKWLQSWTFGETGKSATSSPPPPSIHTILGLSHTVPKGPITVYRAHAVGAPHSDIESWTSQKGLAQAIVSDKSQKRKLLKKTVHPDEILFDGRNATGKLKEAGLEDEVIVVAGKQKERMNRIRTSVVRNKLTTNTRFQFLTDDEKLKAFNKWFADQVKQGLLQVDHAGDPWTAKYVNSAYKRGRMNAYFAAHKEDLSKPADWLAGGREQFLRSAFDQPEVVSKLRLLGTRNFEQLKGISAAMSSSLNRILASGIAAGTAPRELARQISKEIDGISRKRALVLARTEIIHAAAEGQLDSFEDMGVKELQITAEWGTAGDKRVCTRCNALSGVRFTVTKARGLIPLHPMCRCSWRPVTGDKPNKLNKTQQKILGIAPSAAVKPGTPPAPEYPKKMELMPAPIPSGPLKGLSPTKIAQWMGGQGWKFDQAKEVFDHFGSPFKDNSLKSQLYIGKTPKHKQHGPATLSPEQIDYLKSLLGKAPPPLVTPPTQPEAPKQYSYYYEEAKKKAAKYGISITAEAELKNPEFVGHAIAAQLEYMAEKFPEVAAYAKEMAKHPAEVVLQAKAQLEIENAFKDGTKAGAYYKVGNGTYMAAVIPGVSHTPLPPNIKGYAVSTDYATLFSHEYGHQIWFQHLTQKQRDEFEKLFAYYLGPGKKDVSAYAATNSRELWAESFAAFTNKKYKPGMLPADLESFLKAVLHGASLEAKPAAAGTPITAHGLKGWFQELPTRLGGSTGAKLVEITEENGTKFKAVMKTYSGREDQVRNEVLTNKLYTAFGIDVPQTWLATVDGKPVMLTRFQEGLTSFNNVSGTELTKAKKQIQKGFVVDSWLANWDVVGLSNDNIGVTAGSKAFRIDNGGALLFRAQGGLKGDKFGSTVGELETLRDKYKNATAAKVFGSLKDEDIVKQIEAFEKRYQEMGSDLGLKAIINTAGFDDATSKKLLQTLDARVQYLTQYREQLLQQVAEAAKEEERRAVFKAANDGWLMPPPHPAKKTYKTYEELFNGAYRAGDVLTRSEKDAIRNFSGGSYGSFNNYAVQAAKKAGETTSETIKALDSGLAKMPGWEGWSCRGVAGIEDDKWQKWISGEWARVEWAAYSSSSVSPGREFTSGNDGCAFLIKNKGIAGAYIEPHSSHQSEKELTLRRGSRFRVLGWAETTKDQKVGGGRHRRLLLIEEISSDTKVPESQEAPKQYDAKELYQMFIEAAKKAGIEGY